MTRLTDLYEQHGQSPWLDNLRREWLRSGELQRWVERGVRGITSNPSTFQKAMAGASDYDEQFREVVAGGASVLDAYWELAISDIEDALALLRPVHETSGGDDGFVSLEVAPDVANDTAATADMARSLHERMAEPNLYVKIPGTAAGLPAIRQMISEGRSINVTLLFALERYDEVIEAYLAGLEDLVGRGGDPSHVRSVASFFVSRVDTEVDRRLDAIGSTEARALKHRAAIANARLAYQLFTERFSGDRWNALQERGAAVQRPLWASTSTKDPSLPDTLYVDALIAPNTVNTMPEGTLEAFEDHGRLERTADADPDEDRAVLDRIREVGVDLDDVSRVLEEQGVAAFAKSFDELISTLGSKAVDLGLKG